MVVPVSLTGEPRFISSRMYVAFLIIIVKFMFVNYNIDVVLQFVEAWDCEMSYYLQK